MTELIILLGLKYGPQYSQAIRSFSCETMKINILILIVVVLLSGGQTQAVTDPLLDELLKRNGDVYLLVSDSKTDTGYLYRFDRSDNYRRNDVIPPSSPLKSRLPQYVGFAVDKFGHIKLFRAKDDIDNPTGSTSILELTNRTFPGQTGSVKVGANTMAIPRSTSVKSTSAGWRYVIAPDGKEGWKHVFSDGGKDTSATSGSFTLSPIDGAIPVGSVILPPYFKSMPFQYFLNYHGGFWQGGRQNFRAQAAEAPPIVTAFYGGHYKDRFTTTSCWYDIPYGASEELWGIGRNCGVPLSPPIGSFFMIPHYIGNWAHNWGRYRAATNVRDAKKSVKTLLVNTFLSQQDNSTLQTFGPTSGIFTNLQAGRDYFGGVTAQGYSDGSDNVLANTVSFSVDAGRWNHCGDLCGLGPSDSPASPPPPPSSRAYASSFGDNQDEQKMYMIRRASYGGSNIVTSVVEIRVAKGGNSQATLVDPNQSCPSTHDIDRFGIDCRVLGDADLTFTTLDKQVVYRALASDLGVAGSFPNYPRSLGFSKRRDGSKSDYVYWSNLPPTHFTVSSNFWGTGGTIWYAVENGNNLKLHFRNFNHTIAGSSSSGVIDGGDRLPVRALASDGDNNVFLVHSKDAVEGPEQIERQFGDSINKTSVQNLCASGVMKNCNTFDFTGGMPACLNAGVPTDPLGVELVMKQHAGFVVEKLSPVTGSQPVKLGVVPNVEIGECRTTAYFPLSGAEAASCQFRWDRPASGTDPWSCSAGTASGVDLSNINIELAVINVPNPPASGTGMNVRIVHPCYANSVQVCDVNKTMIEDQEYTFRMENPPHFAGVPAVLGQSSDGILRGYGTVRMISNYEKSGYDYTGELPLNGPEAGTINDLYFDNDGEVGLITATMLNEEFKAPADSLMSSTIDQGAAADRTMRYRWLVRAKSPPHSLVDYAKNDLEYKPPGSSDRVKTGCSSIVNPTGSRVLAEGITVYTFPHLQDPTVVNKLGLMYDSCWQDLDRVIAKDPQQLPVYAPNNLRYKFVDPGVYEVTLMIGALGFDLEDITYRSDPASVRASIIVTHHTMKINVGAQKPGTNPFVTDVGIGAKDLKSGGAHHWHFPDSTLGVSDLKGAFATKVEGNMFKGSIGSLPVYPVNYYSNEDLVVTQEGQITPLYAEAKIRFFGTENTAYLNATPTPTALQNRMDGTGVWDFSYTCTANSNCGEVGGVKLTNKLKEHPSNYGLDSAGVMTITSKFGNDASLDLETRRGSGRFVRSSGGVITEGLSSDPNELHQGTLARDDYYPDGKDIETSPHAFYTWYDIKYAWFARFRAPDGDIRKKIIRTGNLAEIFLLNYYANHGGSNRFSYKKVISDVLAPKSLEGNGFNIGEGKLISKVDALTREYHVRIPLLQNNAIFVSSDPTDPLKEMDGNLKPGWRSTAEWSTKSVIQILKDIRPMKFDIPTGATVIEVGFQLFAPVMTWQGNEAIIKPDGTTSDIFSYYDAVPAKLSGSDIVAAMGVHPRAVYNFGADNIETWATIGTLKGSGYGKPVEVAGLQLAIETAGFTVENDGKANYQNRADHFIAINVVDQQNPSLKVESGGNQSVSAGQANEEPIVFKVTDNNPFQAWLSYDAGPNDTSKLEQGMPVLSNFYYELGYDSRSRMGLGLLGDKSYSFHLSHREQENYSKNAAFNYDSTTIDGQYNLPDVYPGEPAPDKLSNDANNFFSFGQGSGNRDNDQVFNAKVLTDSKASMYAAKDFYWNKDILTGTLFPPSVDGVINTSNVYDDSTNTRNQPMLYQWLSPHMPDGSLNYSNWPLMSDNSNRRKLSLVSEDYSKDCLKTALPQNELSVNCSKTAKYELEVGAAFAPMFFNNDYALSRKIFAAGQDARIFAAYPDAGAAFAPDIKDYYYRLTGKSPSLDILPTDLVGASLSMLRSRAQEILYEPLAKPLGTFDYVDKSPPNLRVTLTDYKSRQSIHYSLLMIESVNKVSGTNQILAKPRINIYRSADSRAIDGNFASSEIKKTLLPRSPENEYTISGYAPDLNNPSEYFYEITEDTRFQVHVTFSDNVTGKNLEGSIEMSSGSCSDLGSVPNTVGSLTLSPLDGAFMEQYRFPTINKNVGQYQDLAEFRAYHLYPKNGYFDNIKIVATDSVGNKTGFCIPVRVIPQDVHFRQIGNQSKSR